MSDLIAESALVRWVNWGQTRATDYLLWSFSRRDGYGEPGDCIGPGLLDLLTRCGLSVGQGVADWPASGSDRTGAGGRGGNNQFWRDCVRPRRSRSRDGCNR